MKSEAFCKRSLQLKKPLDWNKESSQRKYNRNIVKTCNLVVKNYTMKQSSGKNSLYTTISINHYCYNKAEYIQEYDNISPMITKYPYIVKICPVHLRAAQYMLRVDNTITNLVYQYNNSNI